MSWTNCIDCGINLDSDARPDVYRGIGTGGTKVALCDECFGVPRECGNCANYEALLSTRLYGDCDMIRDEQFVELFPLAPHVPDVQPSDYRFEVMAEWSCGTWTAK